MTTMILKELLRHSYEFIGLLMLLGCSAFFSGSETALFSLTREDLRKLERDPSRSGRYILAMLRSPSALLSAILFGNMVVNVAFYSLSVVITLDLAARVSRSAAVASGVVALFAVVVFGEVSPKGIAVGRPRGFAHLVAPVLYGYMRLMWPVSAVLRRIAQNATDVLSGWLPHMPYVTREELKMLVEMAEQRGLLEADTRAMIQQVVELAAIRVSEVMVPRVDMPMFNLDDGRERLHELIRETHEDRVVVYEGSRDNVLGILVSRDAFVQADRPVREFLRPVRFVPETQTVESLLRQFRETGDPIAIVADEYGGTAGLVSLEHVFEEVVGEIRNEFEEAVEPVRQLDEDTYLLAGDLNTREWRQLLGVGFDPPGVDTVGGFVTALLGHIPSLGEGVAWRGLWFQVEEMAGRRVDLVRVERMREEVR